MRRALLIGGVAGVAALLASGVASFWLTANVIALPDAPRPCSAFSSDRCFGTVAVGDVVKPLRERGFACTEAAAQCDLSVGGGAYRVLLLNEGDAMHGYRVEARFDRALGPSRRALDLLSWFARLPFGHDPATASAASAWTLQQVRAHTHSAATINGCAYEVAGNGDQAGASLPECPSGSGCTVLFLGYLMLSVQAGSP
jgi:hypothetical protein